MIGRQSPGSSQAGTPPTDEWKKDTNQLVISYMYLRKTVGWIGTLLPVVLIAGNVIFLSKPASFRKLHKGSSGGRCQARESSSPGGLNDLSERIFPPPWAPDNARQK